MASKPQGIPGGGRRSGGTPGRGFASIDPERQREVPGEAVRAARDPHRFTAREVREAVHKGGLPADDAGGPGVRR